MCSASNPISHHTSHTLANGASSSEKGAVGDGKNSYENGYDGGTVTEASPMCSSGNLSNLIITDGTLREGEEYDEGSVAGASSLCSSSNLSNFKIIDSTLREGEQFATAYFNTAQKIQIAKALDDFGVEYVRLPIYAMEIFSLQTQVRLADTLNQIELTSPAASKQSRADCEAICKLNLKAKILTHIRCHMDDARIAIQTGVDGINVAIGTSSHLMKHSHGKDLAFISMKAKEVIEYVKAHNLEIRFSGEDSFRSDFAEILKLYATVDRLGVNRVGIADTVGSATPREVFEKIDNLRKVVGCDIETHFHNDTGCAIANAYCALESGATHIDTTVLGVGERNGITPLGGLMACLIVADRKYIVGKYRIDKLSYIENLVAQAVEVEIPFNNYDLSSIATAGIKKPEQAS